MLAVDEKRLSELVQVFYRAFLAADSEALAEVVAPEAAWIVRLKTALSGAHVGPRGIAALRRQIEELRTEPGVRYERTASTSPQASRTP